MEEYLSFPNMYMHSPPISIAMSDHRVQTERELMKQCSKLLLWHTRNCKPLMTQNDLVPIMTSLGFVPALPLSATKITNFIDVKVDWIEFKYCGASAITTRTGAFCSHPRLRIKNLPTPRLPYPYIDGLHLFTYRAFLEAVNFYLMNWCFDDIFHLQGIPAHLDYPELRRWQYAEESRTIFRLGTLDPDLIDLYSDDIADFSFMPVQVFPEKEQCTVGDDPEFTMAPIDDIVVTSHHPNNSSSQDHQGAEDIDDYTIYLGSESPLQHTVYGTYGF